MPFRQWFGPRGRGRPEQPQHNPQSRHDPYGGTSSSRGLEANPTRSYADPGKRKRHGRKGSPRTSSGRGCSNETKQKMYSSQTRPIGSHVLNTSRSATPMTQGHARSDPIHAEKAQADPRERLAQQQPHRAGAVRPAPPRDVPSSAVAGDTTVRKYYANFPAVDKSDHPAYRPPLPRRPPVPPREGPSNVAGTIAANPPISHPNTSSSIHTSKASVTSSACISEASTPATSTLPEPVVPRNARQEPLRQFAWLGFSVDAPLDLSDLAKAQKRTVTTGGRERHSHFRLPNGNHGIISPRAREVHWEGNTVVFPRNSMGRVHLVDTKFR